MALADRFPLSFPHRRRLDACEQTLQSDGEGRRVVDNFTVSLQQGLLTDTQFERFCTRLGAILPDPPTLCSAETVTDQIDTPAPFYCQGPQVQSPAGGGLSRVMDFEGFLRASLRRRPSRQEYNGALHVWQQRPVGSRARHTLQLRGRRAFFWVTLTDRLPPTPSTTPDVLRNLLGLDYRQGFLMEAQLPADLDRVLHRPTVMDALNNTFFPAVDQAGWGITDDLSGSRPTPGLPEAVTPMAELECEVMMRGQLTVPPPRFF